MKRVLVGASILAAFMTTATGMAAADSQPSNSIAGAEIAQTVADASSGSSDLLGALLLGLSSGSDQECPGVELDTCVPIGAQPASAQQAVAQPIADSGSALMTPETVLAINHALGWLYNGSSEPCVSLGPNCAWE